MPRNETAARARAVRIAFLDDLPAVRAGLVAMVASEPDLVSVGVAADSTALESLVRRKRPDVVVLDVDHPGRDGLELTLRLATGDGSLRIVLYSGRATPELKVAAAAAGASGFVSKSDDRAELLTAIRRAATGAPGLALTPGDMAHAAARLEPTDRAILAMLLAGTSLSEVATTIGTSVCEIRSRVTGFVAELTRPSPSRSREDMSGVPALRRRAAGDDRRWRSSSRAGRARTAENRRVPAFSGLGAGRPAR